MLDALSLQDRTCISTHAPLAGRDGGQPLPQTSISKFQPTRPLRGATTVQVDTMDMQQDFNPRAPCGARRDQARDATGNAISTHAPLAGRDIVRSTAAIRVKNFNPRAPCGARPQQNEPRMSDLKISTHAPLAGRDDGRSSSLNRTNKFQPTRPLRGATAATGWRVGSRRKISTHAPLAGRDPQGSSIGRPTGIFQPTRPLRGATALPRERIFPHGFQPTRPLRGATSGAQAHT